LSCISFGRRSSADTTVPTAGVSSTRPTVRSRCVPCTTGTLKAPSAETGFSTQCPRGSISRCCIRGRRKFTQQSLLKKKITRSFSFLLLGSCASTVCGERHFGSAVLKVPACSPGFQYVAGAILYQMSLVREGHCAQWPGQCAAFTLRNRRRPGQLYVRSTIRAGIDLSTTRWLNAVSINPVPNYCSTEYHSLRNRRQLAAACVLNFWYTILEYRGTVFKSVKPGLF
jgi:hypothetical protein